MSDLEGDLTYRKAPGWQHCVQAYIAQEVVRPCKQWIHEVLCAKREADRVRLRTETFVLLPNVDTVNKRACMRLTPFLSDQPSPQHDGLHPARSSARLPGSVPPCIFNSILERRWRARRAVGALHWLAVVTDKNLRTVRHLRGHQIPMLQQLYTQCCCKIQEETGIPSDQIMAYVHYPPSVYQLHIHFKHPVAPHL